MIFQNRVLADGVDYESSDDEPAPISGDPTSTNGIPTEEPSVPRPLDPVVRIENIPCVISFN